jgi:hypothetical protein
MRAQPMCARVDLPVFRDGNGVWHRAITLPEEICDPMGQAVLDELVATRTSKSKGPYCHSAINNLQSELRRTVKH